MVWMAASAPGDLGIALNDGDPCPKSFESLASFSFPWVVTFDASRTEEESTYYQVLFGNLFLHHQQAAVEVMRQCLLVMKDPTKPRAQALGSFSLEKECILDPHGGKEGAILKEKRGLNVGLWASRTEHCDVSVQGYALRDVPHFIQIMSGKAVCIVIDKATQLKVGDVASWVASASSGELADFPSLLVNKGDVVFAPHGSQPIVVGIPETIKVTKDGVDLKGCKENQFHHFCCALMPIFDIDFTASATTPEERLIINSTLARSKPALPDSWVKDPAVQAWINALAGANE